MGKKKSYNPFKMWGSYVGAVLVYAYLTFTAFPNNCAGFSPCLFSIEFLSLIALGGSLIGFLIGWGVHSLIRKVRK